MEDTCTIEPDLDENEFEDKEGAAEEEGSTKSGDIERIWEDFPEIERAAKKDQEKEKESVKESVLHGNGNKDVKNVELEVEDIEKEEVDEVKEQEVDDEAKEAVEKVEEEVDEVKEEVDEVEVQDMDDEVKEVGFAAQTVASLGFGFGITVHGSALVFPAVAVPRLKQVSCKGSFQNCIVTRELDVATNSNAGDNTRGC